MLNITDLGSIESRVLGWVSDCKGINDAFATGKDTYKIFASELYDTPYDLVSKKQRNFSKPPVLGCFGKHTEVLTDTGWRGIVSIVQDDLLWDGKEFVRHDGVIFQGVKEVQNKHGVQATPDHEFYINGGWRPWEKVSKNDLGEENTLQGLLSDRGASKSGQETISGFVRALSAQTYTLLTLLTSIKEKQRAASSVLIDASQQSGLWRWLLESHKDFSTDLQIGFMPSVDAAPTIETRHTITMGREESGALLQIPVPSYLMSLLSEDGIVRVLRLTELIMREITKKETSDFPLDESSVKTLESLIDWHIEAKRILLNDFMKKSPQNTERILQSLAKYERVSRQKRLFEINSTAKVSTYDILNSGPRYRYTIKTSEGPAIVHNCGYRLGAYGLMAYAAGMGVTLTLEEAERMVALFRSMYWEVPEFWAWCKSAVFSCTRTGARVEGPHGLSVHAEGEFLFITLPSGRRIAYHKPAIVDKPAPWDEEQLIPQFTFMGRDKFSHKWTRISAHDGHICENIIQAIARDILGVWMKRVAKAGYSIVLHVHDEIGVEHDKNVVEELNALIRIPIKEYPGLILDAEGFIAKRYRKG